MKTILLAILIVTAFAYNERHTHNSRDSWATHQEESIQISWKEPETISNNSTSYAEEGYSKKLRNISKSRLWRIFDYINQGVPAKDDKCRGIERVSQLEKGCCMKGRYYDEEKCWITLISIAVFSTAFLICALVCIILITAIITCACYKRCKRQNIIEMLKKKKEAAAKAQNPQPAQPQVLSNTKPQLKCNCPPKKPIQPQLKCNCPPKKPIQPPLKCNCPPKKPIQKIEKNIPEVHSINTTSQNDFGYQPPKLIPKSEPKVEIENVYPKFEDIKVSNPYPQFDAIVKSKYLNKSLAESPIQKPIVQSVPKKVCTCKKQVNNVYDINTFQK